MSSLIFSRRLALFPSTTRLQDCSGQTNITIAGCDLHNLADIYGTPLYLYDRVTLDDQVTAYRLALAQYYPGESGITYASKAYLCLAIAQWANQQGLWLDCTGEGELAIAAASGSSSNNILVHGVNKSSFDIQAAIDQAGTLVIDNLDELARLVKLNAEQKKPLPNLWLRFRPGLSVNTHDYTQTGQQDSKFGMQENEIEQAIRICLHQNLPLIGLHFHQGSHFHDPQPLGAAIESILDLAQSFQKSTGWCPGVISPGGGWGVPYHEDDLPHPTVDEYVRFTATHLIEGCKRRSMPLPRLQLEPGRSLIARAGVAVYRLGAIKQTPNRRWLLLDGGLADNPRPALYHARYSALPVQDPERSPSGPAWLAGPYCESGDVLIESLPMPEMDQGELIAIPVSGAYQLSMSSNYNGARRPAVIWLEQGAARLIQRRESLQDLFHRDLSLFD
jgi:diaminopimelate decarboxylase